MPISKMDKFMTDFDFDLILIEHIFILLIYNQDRVLVM